MGIGMSWSAVGVAGLAVACGGRVDAQGRVELPAADRALEVHVDTLYRLGGVAARGWQQFERIRDVAFDGEGRLHVFDQGQGTVRVVDGAGRLVRSVGRQGDGPGELSAPYAMAVGADGTVAVSDLGRRSVALFGPEGAYLGNIRLDGSLGAAPAAALDGRGNALGVPPLVWAGRVGSSDFTPGIRTEGGVEEDPSGVPVVRMPLDGGGADVVERGWIPPREGADGTLFETAFLPRIHWTVLPGGEVAVTDSLDYRIRIVGEGETRILTRPVGPRAVSARDREGEIERRVELPGSVGGGGGVAGLGADAAEATQSMIRQRRARVEAGLHYFAEHQVVRDLLADAEGRLWVERLGRTPWVEGPIDVVTGEGEYVGTIDEGAMRFPDALGPDGLAVWLETDELDVPVVTVGRVRPGGPGGPGAR